MSWKKVKLRDIIKESKIPSNNPNPDRRIKVKLKVLGVEKRGLENEIEGATKQYIRKAGQFIYGKQNFHKGAFGIIPEELNGYESSADLPSFDVSRECLPEWLFYFFKQGNYYLELAKIARGVATQRIHPEQIYDIEIPLPDLKTQNKYLLNIYSIENKGKEITNELILQLDLIKQLRQALLRETMQGKLVKQINKDGNAKDLLQKIKIEKKKLIAEGKLVKDKIIKLPNETIPFEIPPNWIWCRLNDIAEAIDPNPSHRMPHYVDLGVPFISTENFKNDDTIDFSIGKKVSNEILQQHIERYEIHDDSFAFSRIGSIGKTIKLPPERTYCLSHALSVINPFSKEINLKYLRLVMGTGFILKQAKSDVKSISVPDLGMAKIRSFFIPLPPFNEQNRIVEKLGQLIQICDDLQQNIQQNKSENVALLQSALKTSLKNEKVE